MSIGLRCMTSLYITRGEEVLLLYRVGSRVVDPSWCGVGGHFEEGELHDPRACVLREVGEEIGLRPEDLTDLRLRYVTLRQKRGEIRQNFYFFAGLRPGAHVPAACDEGELRWMTWQAMEDLPMPHSARAVLGHYRTQGCLDERLYGAISEERDTVFREMKEF